MGLILEDGTGGGHSAEVTSAHRLATESLIIYPMEQFAHSGSAFWVATDFISLTTTGSYSGIFHLINTSTTDRLHVAFWRQSSTVGTQWRMIKNATTGTLISTASAITPQNARFDSGKVASATCYKGADALTITNGSLVGQLQTPAYSTLPLNLEGSIVLNYSNSISIEAKPSAAAQVGVTVTFWFETNPTA